MLLLLTIAVSGCGNGNVDSPAARIEQMTPEQAREELKQMNIEFSEWSFLFKIRENNVKICRLFLKAGMSPETKDLNGILSPSHRGMTAYTYVMSFGHPDIFMAMIEAGTDVNAADERGMTALMHAAFTGNTKLVDALIQRGADVNASYAAGWTPLLFAVASLPIDPSKALTGMLLDAATGLQAELNGKGNRPKNETPEAHAESEETIRTVKILLAAGADVNHKMAHGETPLMFAAQVGRPGIGKMLLEAGADPAATNLSGDTALAIAKRNQRTDVVQMLQNAGIKE
jgi:ankyrin repeat protein